MKRLSMKAAGASNRFWSWLAIAIGLATVLLALNQAILSLVVGSLQFSSSKYGFIAYGIEAAMICAVLLIGSILIIGIGWRGLRLGRQDA